jgi:ATP-dependent Clp protease protease subunit
MSTATALPSPKDRVLFLSTDVDAASMNALTKSILEINENDAHIKKTYALHDLEYTPKPIKIYIDSYGGYLYQCMGLLSVMEKSAVPVHTIVTGCAMSCGFLIAISGHKRFGYENSTYMYHQVSSGGHGKTKDLEENFMETLRLQRKIEELTARKTKIKASKLKKIYETKRDWFIESAEALKLKVIDDTMPG